MSSKEIPERILAEVNPDADQMYEDIARWLNESLKGCRYLIVLDDTWDRYMAVYLQTPAYSLRKNRLVYHFPDEENGSRILFTSRLRHEVLEYNHIDPGEIIEMRLLNNEESWHFFREKVFAQEPCPYQLEIFGRKIAEKCEGLPLTIVTVANHLSKVERTAEYWNEITMAKHHQVFKDAYNEILKVLHPSYKHLPPLLQMCFMFLGVFPPKYEIPLSILLNLWDADGFLEQYLHKSPYAEVIECCLGELASNIMVITCYSTIISNSGRDMKSCMLNSSMWHLSDREGRRSKFSYVLNTLGDALEDAIKGQHRLSFQNNILLGIKDVRKSVEGKCAFTAQALLCYAPYLQYQVHLCFGLRLLKELDALSIRFYEFPTEVLQLVELRYLALTLNGEVPAAISRLSNLKFLIVDPHLRIKSCEASLYLPMEIWKMRKLQHLQVTGSDLSDPRGASLKSLLRLSRISPNSCTKHVFEAIPNLEKVGIQVELAPDNEGEPLSFFGRVSHLRRLSSLTCVVVNPKVVLCSAPLPTFPCQLKKLSLSGLGYPWEEIRNIASLRHLEVLKLRNYAFRGPRWQVRREEFPELVSLVIEDIDLVKWEIGGGSLKTRKFHYFKLRCLIIKLCYKLKEIEMVDCNPLGTEQMKRELRAYTSDEVKMSCSLYK